MKDRFLLRMLLVVFAILPRETHAIPPPDVLSNIGSSFVQIASLLMVFASIALSFVIQHTKRIKAFMKGRSVAPIIVSVMTIVLALWVAYGVSEMQRIEMEHAYNEKVAQQLKEAIEKRDTTEDPKASSTFYEANKDLPLMITNEEFAVAPSDAFVLDAREDEEYEIGFYAGSTHIRFADILAGAWTELPTDRIVYVMCWSGIRGGEVASFLREKGIVARALEEGANGWVETGGAWEGEIAFSHVYSDEQYSVVFTLEEMRALQSMGAILVNTRLQDEHNASPIPNSISISSIYTPTDELEVQLDQVPEGFRVITICDDFVSCFDAKIVGIKLEKRGNIFLGRYATPWEW